MGKKHHFKAWEDEIIKQKWRTTTDEEIGKEIGRTAEAVANRRKKLGFSKANGRPSAKKIKQEVKSNPSEYSLAALSKEDRISFYKSQ